jgi:tetratricopeptide (TPR) repeat protein
MDLVPHYMSDNLHEQLDAVMPEALALAREAKNPWIEVFLRHWALQSRILQRYQVKEYLSEAVNLIDFANKEETKDCPQSVCTTQDLANCYAHLDGPGFAKERLEVARETLARITPEWPCFTCISGEYATALLDGGEHEEALRFIEKQKSELIRIGRADRKDEMVGTNIDALVALGRLDEALAMNRIARDLGRGESFMEFRRLDEARILARLGRLEEAKKHLLPFDEVVRTPSQYEPWAEAVFLLAQGGALDNGHGLHVEIEELVENMRHNGVARRAIQLALWQGRLAVMRERPDTAARSADTIRALLPNLRVPLRAPADLEALEKEIAALRARLPDPPPLPDAPEAVLKALVDDPELDLPLLERAHRAWPEDERIVLAFAEQAARLHDHALAIEALLVHLRRFPDAADVVLHLLHTYRGAKDRKALESFAEETLARSQHTEVRASCLWALALDAEERSDRPRAKALLEQILVLKPEAVNTRLLLAKVERELGDLESALFHLDRIVKAQEAGPWDWDRMLVATLLDRWDAVRDSAKRVGMNLEGEGPIADDGELVRIEIAPDHEDDDPLTYYAIRTGPVTARIVEVAHPFREQHYADRVVFDARPKNAPPKSDEESGHTFIYHAVRITRRGGYRSALLDGAHPGETEVQALKQAMMEIGCRLEQRSDASYAIEDQETGERISGFYAFIAIPEGVLSADVHKKLLEQTRDHPHRLTWSALAEEAGDAETAEAHVKIAARYQLY